MKHKEIVKIVRENLKHNNSKVEQCAKCKVEYGSISHDYFIKYCPLHESAPKLLEALKNIRKCFLMDTETHTFHTKVKEAVLKIDEAIAKAEPKP